MCDMSPLVEVSARADVVVMCGSMLLVLVRSGVDVGAAGKPGDGVRVCASLYRWLREAACRRVEVGILSLYPLQPHFKLRLTMCSCRA